MKDIEFPIFKTKTEGVDKKFDLSSPEERKEYFEAKAGPEIARLREYLKDNSFIAYMLGKKNSGKGTYAKMLQEIVDPDRIEHFSIGDMMRGFDEIVADKKKKKELVEFLEKNYRGYVSLDDIVKSIENRKEKGTKVLLPSELILALVKKEIADKPKKALFIDGFPRTLDQVSYSLFFRDLIGYRDDPDVFILIDVPENVIDERIKYRLICPECNTSRNLKLLPTKEVRYDEEKKEYYLICDGEGCEGKRMVPKEGDELGIEPIKERLQTDEDLIKKTFALHGIPKVVLRNSIPVDKIEENTDDYELTPEFSYEKQGDEIKVKEQPWKVKDDNDVLSHSLMPPAVVVSLIKQLVEVLGI